MNTIHRPVSGYEDLYANTFGGIVHGTKGVLTQKIGPKGYWYVSIPGVRGTVESHRLVAAAFLGPRPAGVETRHGPGGKLDNSPGNLCYGTHRDNMRDAIRDGRHSAVFHGSKTECPKGHAYAPENTYRDKRGSRHCRLCRADQARKQDAKRKARRAEKRSASALLREG